MVAYNTYVCYNGIALPNMVGGRLGNGGTSFSVARWRKTWSIVTLSFAAIVFAALAMDQEEALAQEAPAPKAKDGK